MQRLYSMFPNGWPGRGLLLLRLVVGCLLIHDGIVALMGPPERESIALQIIAAIAAIFLLIGLWTPLACTLVTLTELGIVLRGTDQLRSVILLAAIAIAITILGPGAQSIDAILFGRKRLDL